MTAKAEPVDRGRALLAVARQALEEALGVGVDPAPGTPAEAAWLEAPGASFVTLVIDGELRGCIGSLEPYRPLVEDVRSNALAAAFRDPRFPRLGVDELARVRIEVSVLSPLEPVACSSEAELLGRMRPGVDGLVLEHDGHRGTFLPAVWEKLPFSTTPSLWDCYVKYLRQQTDHYALSSTKTPFSS